MQRTALIDLKDMRVLVSLARHANFSDAAMECGISQPAFSARLRGIENFAGVSIVRRSNKFQGFTPEGDILLAWSRKILSDTDAMVQDLNLAKGGLSGRLVLGAVPTAVPFAATLASHLRDAQDGVTIEVQTLSSRQIDAGLRDYNLDAGITYTDALPDDLDMLLDLYEEHYVLLAPRAIAPRSAGSVTWAEASGLPLSLLNKTMRNRRFIDAAFEKAGVLARPVMETNGFTASLTQVATGSAATIVPEGWAKTLPLRQDTVMLTLERPSLTHAIGLVIRKSGDLPAKIRILKSVAQNSL